MRHMIFGESHGPAIGVVLEGVPAGLELDLEQVQKELDRGKPGQDPPATPRGPKERYEVSHGVKTTDGAIIAAATLSNRYITDRFLPDKAIDLVDEACAMIRTEIDSMATELDVNQR